MSNLLFQSKNIKKLHITIPDFFIKESIPDGNYNSDIDEKITETLVRIEFEYEHVNSITIPISLGYQFLELSGLRLAYHIRLSRKLKFTDIPLILFGAISLTDLLQLSPFASILNTPNVYYVDLSKFDFNKVADSIRKIKNKKFELGYFLDFIKVSIPANYDSHHSIANEWAIKRYFDLIDPDPHNIFYQDLEGKINKIEYLHSLHFKYTEAISIRQHINPKKHSFAPKLKNDNTLKIGIIDDEVDKGWGALYSYIAKTGSHHTECFKFTKDENRKDLISRLNSWVDGVMNSEEPIDVFIVDLRLHDDDFLRNDFLEHLTGTQIIKKIKSVNKGAQVIVSTASNKVWRFKEINIHGINSFVVKESPETFNSREESKQSLTYLVSEIDRAIDNVFLAEIYRTIKEIKNLTLIGKDTHNTEFYDKVFGNKAALDQIFELLVIDPVNHGILNQCLLMCFQILEMYCNLPLIGSFGHDGGRENNSGYVWLKNNTKFTIFNKTINGYQSIFEFVLGRYAFQSTTSPDTPISFVTYPTLKTSTNINKGLDGSFMTGMISVLKFRHNISDNEILKLMELRYYRSNVSAHLTGKIDTSKRCINAKHDILFFIKIFKEIFAK